MASLQVSTFPSSSCCSSSNRVKAAIHVPKFSGVPFSAPNLPSKQLFEELKGFTHAIPLENKDTTTQSHNSSINSKAITQLYAILEAVADRVEMHHNMGEQRDNWNTLLLNSINMIALTASTMAGVASISAATGAPVLALKLSSALLFSAVTGMSLIMNKIQPSQLAEEQRNATRLFKQLQTHIQTTIAIGNPTEKDVKDAMQKVLALDKAYPLPLLGAMLEKFPAKFEPAVWWPKSVSSRKSKFQSKSHEANKVNGWNEGLEMELREVIEVVKKKDIEDYERLGNLVLKINKTLAIAGPLLGGVAAVGSAFASQGSWGAIVPVMAGALAAAVNSFEHGCQVGMVVEMYRNCAGFFQLLGNSIEDTIEEDVDQREDGDLLEMKLALKLGRSLSQMKELARKSVYSRIEGTAIDEFASKLF
ncbi:hypothetical protein L6164_035915 [Bauhinia variegata]|uniref:Uncharacterized protein n=1 Tax=Bauhinia variegata TaxID=167791 RepID=A0ACB9KFI1_BAUVA|nr:hypothetical protein L6164_035915 [Bauhinia variegata]